MNSEDQKEQIDNFLHSAFFGVLSYVGTSSLTSQLVHFAHTTTGTFFLRPFQKKKDLFLSLKQQSSISLLIYKEEEDLEDMQQVLVEGTATLLDDMESPEVKFAYEILGKKSPLVQMIGLKLKEYPEEFLVRVEGNSLSYASISEMQKQETPTILNRVINE